MTKKQLVINAAIELFAEKGIEATSIQQITEKCGISKGAFYLTFKSKEELILAIIDHFMQDITKQIDHSVNAAINADEKLYNYFFTSLKFLYDYKHFALIFLREQMAAIGEQCFQKIMYYEKLSTLTLVKMLDDIYGEQVAKTKIDLTIFMQGILKAYMNVILFSGMEIDIKHLANVLVEKTTILAKHSKLAVMTPDLLVKMDGTPITSDTLIEELHSLDTKHLTDLQKESIEVLLSQLQSNKPNQAIIYGVCHNLNGHQKAEWIAFLIKNYIQSIEKDGQ